MKSATLKLLFAILIAMFATSAAKARDEITITGTVVGVNLDYKSEGHYVYRVRLVLQFKNETDEPIIILRPSTADGRLTFTKDYSVSSSNSEVMGIEPKPDDRYARYETKRDPIASFLELLAQKTPSEFSFAIIAARGYLECEYSIVVENGFTFREEPNEDPRRRPNIVVIPEFAGLKVEFRLSVADRTEGVDQVLSAKRNWKRFGKLLFDDEGRFSIKSAFIANFSTY